MTPDEIAAKMNGASVSRPGGTEAILPSAAVQNHAAFLSALPDGALLCTWFGGTLEGKSDISIHASVLSPNADTWGPAQRLTDDAARSEQNPIIFISPEGEIILFNTAQPSGNQDEARVIMRRLEVKGAHVTSGPSRDLGLPDGTFIRAPLSVRQNGEWLLPLFRCNPRPGQRWNGSYDTAAVAVSKDQGETWAITDVPNSPGAVHMSTVTLENDKLVAFYRRRQADFVHRSESLDGGQTWTSPTPTNVPNNNSSIGVTRLADGRIAMVCNPVSAAMSQDRRESLYDELGEEDDRPNASGGCQPIWGVPRAPLALCLSEDNGRTFSYQVVIEEATGTCLSNNSVDGRNKELSYPVILQRDNGQVEIAYTLYRRAIKHVRLNLDWINGAAV